MKALLLLLLHAGAAAAWRCDGEAQSETPTALPYFSLAAASELAICNDGSAAGYYFRASPTGSPVWLVYLAGGAWCSSPEDCEARWEGSVYPNNDCRLPAGQVDQRCFMSSKDFPAQCSKAGIFDASPDNPLAEANLVYVPYCSSDAFVGDAAPTAAVPWHFRGQQIVEATFAELTHSHGLGASPATLLFGGGSAGARGGMAWLDKVPELVAETVQVVGFLDSPYVIDEGPMDSSGYAPDFAEQSRRVLAMTGAAAMIFGRCADQHPGPDESWRCLYAEHRLPAVELPVLLTAPLFDSWAVCHYVFGEDYTDPRCTRGATPFDVDQRAYVDRWGALTQESAIAISSRSAAGSGGGGGGANGADEGHHVVWSAACYNHHVADRAGFFQLSVNGEITMADMVAAFLAAALGNADAWPASAIEGCTEFECGGPQNCDIVLPTAPSSPRPEEEEKRHTPKGEEGEEDTQTQKQEQELRHDEKRVDEPPSILFVIADDLGWQDLGFRETAPGVPTDLRGATPFIDELAAAGVQLGALYVSPVCSPTRAQLLTGQYALRVGFPGVITPLTTPGTLPLDVPMLPEGIRAQGYATGMAGKWHVGFANYAALPTARGWDKAYNFYGGGMDYYTKVSAGPDVGDNLFLDIHGPTLRHRPVCLPTALRRQDSAFALCVFPLPFVAKTPPSPCVSSHCPSSPRLRLRPVCVQRWAHRIGPRSTWTRASTARTSGRTASSRSLSNTPSGRTTSRSLPTTRCSRRTTRCRCQTSTGPRRRATWCRTRTVKSSAGAWSRTSTWEFSPASSI